MPKHKLDKRLLAVEKVLRERAGRRARRFPDYEHLNGLLQLKNMPEYFQIRMKQVIDGVKERQRLEGECKAATVEQDSNGVGHLELPLGLPDWFR